MNQSATGIATGIGLVFVLIGITCGVLAYVRTVKQHDTLPVWPWADRQFQRVRALWPFSRRVARRESVTKTVALSGSAQLSGTMTATLIRSDESIEDRILRLESRVERAEQQAATDRTRAAEAESDLSKRLEVQGRRLDESDEQILNLARSVAVSTARLQISGLISVGIGTIIMAAPALVALF